MDDLPPGIQRKADIARAVLLEHDMRVIMNICPRIIVMEQGDIIAEGSPEHVQSNKKVIEAYLGKSYQI